MNLKLKRTPGIYVVGLIGAGKSTVGRHLAHRLGWSFVDVGAEIEASRGESEFLRLETAAIGRHVRWIERGRPAVVALGEGSFTQPDNRLLIQPNGLTVWLDCPLETVRHRIGPLARDADAFAALYEARREHYTLADLHILITSDDPEITVAAILAHPLIK